MANKIRSALAQFKMVSTINFLDPFSHSSTFSDALTDPVQVLLNCKCNRDLVTAARRIGMDLEGILTPTCHCKDLNALTLSPNPDKLAMYNLAVKPCTCGGSVVHCRLPGHTVAVDGIVACYYKLEDLDNAYAYASLLVILAPEAPEGYLRMAKALRLMDTSQSPDTIARCAWIYRQAIESVLTYGNKAHKKLQVRLYPSPNHKQPSILYPYSFSDLYKDWRIVPVLC